MSRKFSIFMKPHEEGESDILSLASPQGIMLRSDCGGKGICGKCKVIVEPSRAVSPVTDAERKMFSESELAAGFRLACQTMIGDGVKVQIPDDSLDLSEPAGKLNVDETFSVYPDVTRQVVQERGVVHSSEHDLAADLAESVEAVATVSTFDALALRNLSVAGVANGPLTFVQRRGGQAVAVLSGERSRSLGVAVDIGTTTVAVYLCDLSSGRLLAASGCANPQRRYGEDVISRIAFASENPEGTERLQELIAADINVLVHTCLGKIGADSSDVDDVVVVGNTTMEHLFCGWNPRSLGIAPYLPVSRGETEWRAADLGLHLKHWVRVHVFPVVSGFVGGDTVAAMLWDARRLRDAVTLLIDIGTNGEIVISAGHELWATSCATGPALEGAHISSGMRAGTGAIESVRIQPVTRSVIYQVFGNDEEVKPRGMCGSAIIDSVAEMRKAGLILPNGRLNESMPEVVRDSEGIGRSFTLVPATKTATGLPIQLTLMDIRQIQVAKAALAVGIKLLMERAGITKPDRLVLTGAFGARFNWRNAATIGMLPGEAIPRLVQTVENAAGLGAIAALLDVNRRAEASELARRVKVLDLAKHPDFPTKFPALMDFPEP